MMQTLYLKETGIAALLWSAMFTASVLIGDAELQAAQSVPGVMPALSGHPLGTVASIFINNATVAGLLAVGAVTGGLLTVAVLAFNAVILGVAVSRALLVGLPPTTVVWLILPHVTELVGFWLAAGIGLRGFRLVIAYIRQSDFQMSSELPSVYRTLVAAMVCVGIGALMEGYVSIPMALRLTH